MTIEQLLKELKEYVVREGNVFIDDYGYQQTDYPIIAVEEVIDKIEELENML